jgi:hypothetical protein
MPGWATRARRRLLPDGTLVLRPSWASLGLTAFPLVASLPALVSSSSDGWGRDLRWVWLTAAAANVVLLCLAVTRQRVLLRWDALEQRNLWRSRSVPAADIQAVTVAGNGGLTDSIRIWLADRSSFAVSAVTSADLVVVGDWWLAHRGSAWQPAWTVEIPPVPTAATWWT